jgi:flagellar basal-body rod protein FlgF/flagellar basal-body rod protein FlgG
MESGIYAACSALVARTHELDILANNLANVDTTGYKGESQFYQALTAASGNQPLGALNTAVNRFGVLSGQALNLNAGALQNTGNPLDVAIQGPGFLEVKTSAGYAYTRAGNLQVGAKGELLSAQGDPVMGADAKGKPVPIFVPSGKVAIAGNGTISVDGALVGKLKLVEFAPNAAIKPLGNAYFTVPAAQVHAAVKSAVAAGSLENSNVNPIQAETDLISLQRHFDFLEKAIQIFNNDFDQAAATELPRIGQ